MRNIDFKLGGILVLLLILPGTGVLYAKYTPDGKQHLGNSDCATCHLGRPVDDKQAAMLIASQEALCGKCHPKAILVSHPSGFQPRTKPPAVYPLDWKGDLTCSTCHEVHGTARGLMRGTAQGKALCLSCHESGFFEKMRDGGASTMVGHLNSGIDINAPAIDLYSWRCMSCHGRHGDPKEATSVDRNGVVRHASGSVNHPIGTHYGKAAAFGGYRPVNLLSKKILLPDGKISCVSCHLGYAKEHGKLVVQSGSQTSLCMECHEL